MTQEFDKKYNPTWHAVVGRNFGSYVPHPQPEKVDTYTQDRSFFKHQETKQPILPISFMLLLSVSADSL